MVTKFIFALLPCLAFSFNQKTLGIIEGTMSLGSTEPLLVENEKIIFYPTASLGSFDTFKDEVGFRYFNYQPAQRGNGPVISYRFPEKLDRDEINEKKSIPTRVNFLQNLNHLMSFRSFELASDAKSLSTYQECWQTMLGKPEVQCAILNKQICDRVNRGSYDWDKEYRKDAQAFRKEMKARFQAEVLPDSLNEQLRLSFLKYVVLDDYDMKAPDLVHSFGSGVGKRLSPICSEFNWSEESALEAGFKH